MHLSPKWLPPNKIWQLSTGREDAIWHMLVLRCSQLAIMAMPCNTSEIGKECVTCVCVSGEQLMMNEQAEKRTFRKTICHLEI